MSDESHLYIGVYSSGAGYAYPREMVSGEYTLGNLALPVTCQVSPRLTVTFTSWISSSTSDAVLVILDEEFDYDMEDWIIADLPVEYAAPEELIAKPGVMRKLRNRYNFTNVWPLSTREPATLERCGVLFWLETRIRIRREQREVPRQITSEPVRSTGFQNGVSVATCFWVAIIVAGALYYLTF